MVGYALHNCPADVPAHRVLNHSGKLTAAALFTTGPSMKKRLEAEGHTILNDIQLADFKAKIWDPMQEIF